MGDYTKCRFCEYAWKKRVKQPKSCPRCKRRFDYEIARDILQKIGKEYGYDLLVGGEF